VRTESPQHIAALFPPEFLWGVATSAYQIEGATAADGRGPSIWDTFAERPGAIERGETAEIACDHYNRLPEDLELIHDLGVNSYRFSIAWPRIQPSGTGPVNAAGLAFYERLVDGLLAAGIRPFPTLYHWDLPQALEDSGGWTNRDTAARFAEYAEATVRALGDRVRDWSLFNEPSIFASRGYLWGRYAPGRQSLRDYLRSVHVITLAHADGWHAAKAARPGLCVGSVYAQAPCEPATDSTSDRDAAAYAHAVFNRLFLSPLMTGEYPSLFLDSIPPQALGIQPGDMERMKTPLDFIGVNCYYRLVLSTGGDTRPDLPYFLFDLRSDARSTGGHADFTSFPADGLRIEGAFGRNEGKRTEMGWEIWPRALHDVLLELAREYPGTPIEVCESGCAFADVPGTDGAIEDAARIQYHRAHLQAVADAIAAGAPVRSYHAWSLYDNFEWASGYRPRFGLVHVDFATQKRTPKASARWFREVCRTARTMDRAAPTDGNGQQSNSNLQASQSGPTR
jgi:beta-glucosidase